MAEGFVIPQMNVRMATVVVSMVPILIVYPFLQKYFAKGVMVGSVKDNTHDRRKTLFLGGLSPGGAWAARGL
jgi:hypothetical protein